jgi:hypothetical protein
VDAGRLPARSDHTVAAQRGEVIGGKPEALAEDKRVVLTEARCAAAQLPWRAADYVRTPRWKRRQRRSKIADAAQPFGHFSHHTLGQSSQRPEQPSPIDRPRLIDHHLAVADVAGDSGGQLDAQDVLATQRVVQGRIHVLAWSVSFRRSDWTTTTGLTFPASLPRRGFRSADHSSPRRGDRSGIFESVAHQRIKVSYRLECR